MNSQDLRNLQEAYLDVYQELDENPQMQGSLLTRRGTAQNFTSGRSPFTVAEPINQGPRSSVSFPSPNSQVQSPGQLNIPGISQRSIDANIWSRARSSISPDMPNGRQSPRPAWDNLSPKDQKSGAPGIRDPFGRGSGTPPTPPTPPSPPNSQSTSSGGAPGPRPGKTIRATGPTGNFPQLNRFVNNQSSQRMQSTSQLLSLARAGRAGVLGLAIAPTPTSSTDTPGTAPGASRYNTKDASGKIRSHLAVGPAKVGPAKVGTISQAFDKEYAKQKSSGAKTFSFKGKQYTTDSYEPDLFDVILEYLIIEGYADTNENALVIMANMSEDWRESIVEVRGGGKIDPVSDIPSIGERGARSPKDAGLLMSPLERSRARVNALRKRKDPEATKRANRIDSRFVKPTDRAVNRSILAATNARSAEKKRLMQPDADKG